MTAIDVSPSVQHALAEGLPVVALESTIITHGMPYPENEQTAIEVEQAVRDAGATPATIAVLDGRFKVGLSGRELSRLAELGAAAGKCSKRDLPLVQVAGGSAGTTVAATLLLAARAGIRVFATGGVGGVHRGAQETMDISADLETLADTSVALVCAGPKAILDLGLTLEYLETRGVPVLGYGTDRLPAFWSRESPFSVDARADAPEAVAEVLIAKWSLGLGGGVLIANPLPEEHAMDADAMEVHIQAALAAATAAGVSGKAVTPFALRHIEEATGGNSLISNQALILSNARLAAAIAQALASRMAGLEVTAWPR